MTDGVAVGSALQNNWEISGCGVVPGELAAFYRPESFRLEVWL